MFWTEFSMLPWFVFCLEIVLALEDLYGDLWFPLRLNPTMEVFGVMLSLDVSRCAGDICKINVHATNMSVWDIGKRHVFEAVASGGAGDLLLTMNVVQHKSEVLMFGGLICKRSWQQGLR